jgi:predicted PurR-regulated permease PerM
MDASETAAVIVACASVAAVLVMVWAIVSITRTLHLLRQSVEELWRETIPVVNELQQTVQQANGELDRVDSLLGTAESISATVDSASRLAYLAFSNPVIKALAFASGTGRAARRLRRRRAET